MRRTIGLVETFVDDDDGYATWLHTHPEGYVVNADRPPNASYLRLHHSTCRTINGVPATGRAWTVTSTKICGERGELERWAASRVGGELAPCPTCM